MANERKHERLSDEERAALPLAEGSRWEHGVYVMDAGEGTSVEISRHSIAVSWYDEELFAPAVDAMAVLTYHGYNPWYSEAKRLREEVAQLRADKAAYESWARDTFGG